MKLGQDALAVGSPTDAVGSAAAAAPLLGSTLPTMPVGPGATWTQHHIQPLQDLGASATTTHWIFEQTESGTWVLSSSSQKRMLPSEAEAGPP